MKHLKHMTTRAQTFISQPRGYPKTAHGIVDKIRNLNPKNMRARGPAYLSLVFATISDPTNWKAGFYARWPRINREWIKAAILWYHATKPLESAAGIYSQGYLA